MPSCSHFNIYNRSYLTAAPTVGVVLWPGILPSGLYRVVPRGAILYKAFALFQQEWRGPVTGPTKPGMLKVGLGRTTPPSQNNRQTPRGSLI